MKIAIIGTGNLGLSIAKGILNSNGATTMYLTKRNPKKFRDFEKYGNVTVTSDNRKAVENSDILILGGAAQSVGFCFRGYQRSAERKSCGHFHDNRFQHRQNRSHHRVTSTISSAVCPIPRFR